MISKILPIFLLASTPAMAIDFTSPLLNEDGKPYERCAKFSAPKDGQSQTCIETLQITLGQFVFDALNVNDPGLKNDEIVSRGTLALKVKAAKEMDLDDKQRDTIKAALFASYAKSGSFTVTIVQALKIIDPAAVKDK